MSVRVTCLLHRTYSQRQPAWSRATRLPGWREAVNVKTTQGDKYLPGAPARRYTKLGAVMRRWRDAWRDIRDSLLSGARHQKKAAWRSDRQAPAAAAPVAHDRRKPNRAELPTVGSDPPEHNPVPPADEVAQALAVLRDQLLHELDGADVKAAEVRVIVQKHRRRNRPRLDVDSRPGAVHGELAWDLHRLIAWSGDAIADVAEALETHGSEVDKAALELLRDEVAALEIDLAVLNGHLADAVDWDSEFDRLLSGEVAPFDEPADDEDSKNDL